MSLPLPMMHPTKRRRLDASTSTLCKPFRSPLRVDANKRNARPANASDETKDVAPTCMQTTLPSVPRTPLSLVASTDKEIPPAYVLSPSPSERQHRTSTASGTDAEAAQYLTLQKEHSALLAQLSQLRQSLATVQQACKAEPSKSNATLERLITKWRHASRAAAEEVFHGAQEKVNNMGGIRAWRQSMPTSNWDAADDDEAQLTDEQKEQREFMRQEMQRESDMYAPHGYMEESKQESSDCQDESFTIATMLTQMNIDLNVIGYSVELQTWVDD